MRSLTLKAKKNRVMKKVWRPKVMTKNTRRLKTSRSFSKDEVDSNDNHEMKRSHSKGSGMTRTKRAKENALDTEIQITLSKNVQSHKETKTKGLLLEDLGAI
ncbi:hypothetical protein Tco_1498562 [Tanacetum coccineum]